jgi:hypothetical protein
VILLLASACGGDADGSSSARIRVLNASLGYESIDVYSNNGDSSTDTQEFAGVTRGTVTDYRTITGDDYTFKFRRSGTSGNLLLRGLTLAEDMHLTFVTYGQTNQFTVLAIDEDTGDPDSGYAHVQAANTTLMGSFDLYLTDSEDSLNDVSPVLPGIGQGTQSGVAAIEAGTYRLRLTASGSKADVRLNVPQVAFAEGSVVSIVLTTAAEGALLNAVVLPRGGEPTTYSNTESARLRVLNVSVGYDSLDLYTNNGTSPADVQQFVGVAQGTASAYTSLTAASYVMKFRRSGTVGALHTQAVTFAEDTHVTYVAYGTTNRFALQALDEDVEPPDPGYTTLRILNTTSSNELDVYLTGPADSLDDVSPDFLAAAPGTLSVATVLGSGSYRLRITRSGDKTDLRLDVPGIVLESGGVASIVISDTAGGMLVGAVLLPQQGEPVSFANQTVRIRGAVGLSSGAAVTVNVGGTSILAERPARSFIGATYTTLPAGTATATVLVDDAVVASAPIELLPGRDYTLLAWDSGGAIQVAPVTDDNHVAIGERARIRLVNVMSGLGAPLNLSVNYLPVAEYIELGTASGYADIDPGTDFRLDVSNAQSLEPLLTRESGTLKAGAVYTFLLAGGGAGPVAGTLRQDR